MFTLLTPFIVLIERRRLARRLLAALTAFAVAAAGFTPLAAHARKSGYDRAHKVAHDLGSELEETAMPTHRWSRKAGGVKTVQAVIVSDAADPQLGALRAHVEQLGGSVL